LRSFLAMELFWICCVTVSSSPERKGKQVKFDGQSSIYFEISRALWAMEGTEFVAVGLKGGREAVLDLLRHRQLLACTRKVDVRLPGKGNSSSHGARPVHLIITMIKWIRTRRLSITELPGDEAVLDLLRHRQLLACRLTSQSSHLTCEWSNLTSQAGHRAIPICWSPTAPRLLF